MFWELSDFLNWVPGAVCQLNQGIIIEHTGYFLLRVVINNIQNIWRWISKVLLLLEGVDSVFCNPFGDEPAWRDGLPCNLEESAGSSELSKHSGFSVLLLGSSRGSYLGSLGSPAMKEWRELWLWVTVCSLWNGHMTEEDRFSKNVIQACYFPWWVPGIYRFAVFVWVGIWLWEPTDMGGMPIACTIVMGNMKMKDHNLWRCFLVGRKHHSLLYQQYSRG